MCLRNIFFAENSLLSKTRRFSRLRSLMPTREGERATGIEPAWPAWKAGTLPLSYARAALSWREAAPKPSDFREFALRSARAEGFR